MSQAVAEREGKGILDKLFVSLTHNHRVSLLWRIMTVVGLLYFFLVAVKGLSTGVKMLGGGFADSLLTVTANPFVGIMGGMLATALVQSSSVTTSVIVGLVSGGTLGIEGAIPMIMGANLGTSVTNTLVSIGYLNSYDNFKRAFAAATIHDFFNLLSVAVILPIELATGFLQKSATYLATAAYGSLGGYKYSSPIKAAIKPAIKSIKGFLLNTLELQSFSGGIVMIILAFICILISLSLIVKTMRFIVENNKAEVINKMLSKNLLFTILFGTGITIAVQSSSITTSLLVPMAGAGLLNLQVIFPITIGANIGTTTTALLAALTGNVHGLTIALVHFLFNISGALVWYVPKKMRKAPIYMAERLGEAVSKNKSMAFVYIGIVFFALPLAMITLSK